MILSNKNNLTLSEVLVSGTIGFVSQKPWIQNDTLRNNITFGAPFNEIRYQEAIKYSYLEEDIKYL